MDYFLQCFIFNMWDPVNDSALMELLLILVSKGILIGKSITELDEMIAAYPRMWNCSFKVKASDFRFHFLHYTKLLFFFTLQTLSFTFQHLPKNIFLPRNNNKKKGFIFVNMC